MTNIWTNWSGSIESRPARMAEPTSEDELRRLVREASGSGLTVKTVGSGHSFVPLCASDGLLLSLDALRGIVSTDRELGIADIRAGTKIHEIGAPLRKAGLAMVQMGDIDRQSLAGAVSTATHGTGRSVRNLSDQVIGGRLVTAEGEVIEIGETDTELLRAARVSLGSLGVFSQLRLRTLPTYRLHERTWIAPIEQCLEELDDLIAANRHFEFFWTSQRDRCWMKALNPTDSPADEQPDVKGERIGHSDVIFPTERNQKFNEIEFALAAEGGRDCFLEIRELMKTRHSEVEWPLEYRTLADDDVFLSPAFGRDTVTISAHQAAELSYEEFFADVETIFRNHGGRPHWGKVHTHSAEELEALYPRWQDFLAARESLDPTGVFLNGYLRQLLGL